jgi:hypothetical protein
MLHLGYRHKAPTLTEELRSRREKYAQQ